MIQKRLLPEKQKTQETTCASDLRWKLSDDDANRARWRSTNYVDDQMNDL